MKYYLLSVGRNFPSLNIGDYIQALAALQFIPEAKYGFLDRDEDLKTYRDEECKIIMNGWFMHKPLNWPPSPHIHPLFVSFHLNILAKQEMLSAEGIAYLKKHEPIGCRDHYTEQILTAVGINAYFSGCLTLTLGFKYKFRGIQREGVYFVDPYYGRVMKKKAAIWLIRSIPIAKTVYSLCRKQHQESSMLSLWLNTTKFYYIYSQVFDKQLLLNAHYVRHQSKRYKQQYYSEEALLEYAKSLVKKYAQARLVVTSRIHCALPCTGMETPVIFVNNKHQEITSKCRMDGILELFNVINFKKNKLDTNIFITLSSINKLNSLFCPKYEWVKLADKMKIDCDFFLKSK